jgi:hypothetical protein
MTNYYNPVNEMQANYAMPNAQVYLPYHSVMPNFGLQQPNSEVFFHPDHQVPRNFVQESNGPNFFPGQVVINFGNHFYQGHGKIPNSNPRQDLIIDPPNQHGMLRHLNGGIYHATDLWQKILDGNKKELKAAKQADRARMEIYRLGDCTPPRALRPKKRHLHEQDFKQEDISSDVSFNRKMTPAQRRGSIVSNSTSRNLPNPFKFTRFVTPSTPENFKHPGRKSDLPDTESPPKRQKTSDLQRNSSWHQGMAIASPMPVPGGTVSPYTPFAGPVRSAPVVAPGPTASSTMSVRAPATLFQMPALGQIAPALKPVSGPPVSYSISCPGPLAGSFLPESYPPVVCSLGIPGRTASASMSGSGLPTSCLMNVPSSATSALKPAPGSSMRNAATQGFEPLPSPDRSSSTATVPPLSSDMGFLNQDIDGISGENELLYCRDSAAFVIESVATSSLAQKRSNLHPSNSTVREVSIQEGFLPAGNPDLGTPVFGEGEFLIQNYGLEDQNGPSNVTNSLGHAGFLDDLDREEGEYDLGVSYGAF